MAIYQFDDRIPKIAESAGVHETAVIIGDVTIGENCYIGPGAIIRGDYSKTIIGKGVSIQEGVVIHARPGEECRIGNFATIGHRAMLHGAYISDYAVIGMSATVSDWAEIGEWAVVGEGAVVKSKQKIPPEAIAVGVPAKVIDKKIDEKFKEFWLESKEEYQRLAKRMHTAMKKIG